MVSSGASSSVRTRAAATPPVERQSVFGPVIERTIHDWHENPVDSVIDLDSGKLFSMPKDLLPKPGQDPKSKKQAGEAWLRANGIDAGGVVQGIEKTEMPLPPNAPKNAIMLRIAQIGLGGMDMFATPTANDGWDHLTRVEIQSRLAKAKLEGDRRPLIPKGNMTTSGEFPATFLFETREGGMGVLQIVGFTEKPKAVKIRYKLLEDSAKPPPVSAAIANAMPRPISPAVADAYQRGIRLATELAAETFLAQRSGSRLSSDALREKSREFKEATDELQRLCKGTTAEELIRRCLDLDAARSKVDPGRDPAQWRKIGDEEETASFQLALLMLKVGVAGPIHRQAAKLHFGPWKEVTLLQPAEGRECGFDFDAGKTLTPPPDVLKILPDEGGWVRLQDAVKEGNAVVRWVVDSGADVVTAAPNELVLLCPARKQRQIANAALNPDWDRLLTPEYVLWSLQQQDQLMKLLDDGHDGALKGLDLAPRNPAELIFFRTRQGAVGVLQVVAFTKSPKGVKIRYKLLQGLATPQPTKPRGPISP
jgi:hypothetical protein